MKADSLDAVLFGEYSREQVLSAVLLHMVKPAAPVDGALDGVGGDGLGQEMGDAPVLLDDFHHGDAVDGAEIEGLAAGSGIERGLIEEEFAAAVPGIGNGRLKAGQVGVVVIESPGH